MTLDDLIKLSVTSNVQAVVNQNYNNGVPVDETVVTIADMYELEPVGDEPCNAITGDRGENVLENKVLSFDEYSRKYCR